MNTVQDRLVVIEILLFSIAHRKYDTTLDRIEKNTVILTILAIMIVMNLTPA